MMLLNLTVRNRTAERRQPNRLLCDYIITLLYDVTESYTQKWNSREKMARLLCVDVNALLCDCVVTLLCHINEF